MLVELLNIKNNHRNTHRTKWCDSDVTMTVIIENSLW